MKKIALLIISFFVLSINTNAQETATNSNAKDSTEEFTPYWKFAMEGIGFGFLEDGWDGEILSIGANYYFNEKAFIGARIGYKMINYQSSSIQPYNSITSDYECDYISIPIELGYVIYNGNTIKLAPFVGAALNIGWDGESEFSSNGYKHKEDLDVRGKTGVDGRIGIKISLWDSLGISASYHIPLNSKQEEIFTGEDGYPHIGLSYAF